MAHPQPLEVARPSSAQVSRRTLLLGTAAAATLLGGCGSPTTRAASGAALPTALDVADGDVVTGMVAFGHRLVASAGAGGNWICSPLSIACAFAMARVGAAAATATQLDQMFSFPARGRDSAFRRITRELDAAGGAPGALPPWKPGTPPPAPVVSIGNALFTAEQFKLGAAFLRVLAAEYGAGPRPVDFRSGNALAQIDAWVREQTRGRITKLFDKLHPETVLVLANALYFKGYWASPFRAGETKVTPFTRHGGSRVTTPMMSQQRTLRYAAVNGLQAVELPYANSRYAMWVMLPPPGGAPTDLLEPRTIAEATGALAERRVQVYLPRFDFDTDINLRKALERLGLTEPFDPDRANFSGIAPKLYIDEAIHRATITVDERGTEAAAVTGIAARVTSGPPRPDVTFRADRPFAFVVIGGADRAPLFMGVVNDPTAG
jgi:serpin B